MYLSIIICTHNPREDYLRRTLEALKQQTLPKDQWELLLIDNASKEPLAGNWDVSWHPHGKHILETRLGLTPSRVRGIRESKARMIVFVDDDNVIGDNYLHDVLALAGCNENIWVFGAGNIVPEFETPPHQALLPWIHGLGIKSLQKPVWGNISARGEHFPIGAGLAIRRAGAELYLETLEKNKLGMEMDRKGSSLVSSGDIHLIYSVTDQGHGSGCFPELKLTHLIPSNRVQETYLVPLFEGFAHSDAMLDFIRDGKIPDHDLQPTLRRLLKAAFSLSISEGLNQLSKIWAARKKSDLQKTFEAAWRRGIESAHKKISEQQIPRA